MSAEAWLRAHSFLEPVARLHAEVDAALSGIGGAAMSLPRWDDYLPDYDDGVPLLRSSSAAVDLEPAGAMALALVDRLAAGPSGGTLVPLVSILRTELAREPAPAQRIADWLLGEPTLTPSSPGLLRWLGWSAMRRHLEPVLDAFSRWRNEDRWQRSHCPACGALPAMSWLVGVDPGRVRFLSCGSCATRWRWRRTACPFCASDVHRVSVVAIESEANLRIDYCEACRGYLKTCVGEADASWMLADWTSLHLDVLARDRGLERKAESLYDFTAAFDEPAGPFPVP